MERQTMPLTRSTASHVWFFVSYVSAFFSVYVISIIYSIIPETFGMGTPTATAWNSYTYQVNATLAYSTTMISFLPFVLVILIIIACTGLLSSSEAMNRAFHTVEDQSRGGMKEC